MAGKHATFIFLVQVPAAGSSRSSQQLATCRCHDNTLQCAAVACTCTAAPEVTAETGCQLPCLNCLCCCSVGEDPMASTLHTRQAVREAIMSGQVVQATELLRRQCPAVLSGHACSDEVHFHLSCQQYIELIRYGHVGVACKHTKHSSSSTRTKHHM